jgi:O-antigen ligase
MPRHPTTASAPIRFDPAWLTRVALVWALVIIAARFMTTDALRDASAGVPGAIVSTRRPGPSTSLCYDLLETVPALLVLARRAIDKSYPGRFRWSPVLFIALGVFCVSSSFWAADKFAAVVTGLHVAGAAVLLWSVSQLVRSWPQFRLVAALAGGLLLVLVASTLVYRFIDVPDNAKFWDQNKAAILKEHNWDPDSFPARQFEHKLLSGELIGFFYSPNTFAAVSVMLFAACVGIGIFRFRAGDNPMWLVVSFAAAAALAWMLYLARSKTSAATPLIGVAVVAVWAVFGHRLKRVPGQTYLTVLGAVLLTAGIVVGIGLITGHLFAGHFSNSLDFRWKYWTAAAGVFAGHPWTGVGYDNFGPFYLAHRRPEAAEEIIDPHNLVVRCFTEMGIAGGLLLLAWIARLGWELLRPCDELPDSLDRPPSTREPIVIAAVAAIVAVIATTDFDFALAPQVMTAVRFVIYGLALLFGTLAGSLLEPTSESIDPRPAKWIYACLATGLGLFFVANTIDFSWSEPGALTAFAGLAGAALGMTAAQSDSGARTAKARLLLPRLGFGAGLLVWLAIAGGIGLPIADAESLAATADGLVGTAGSGTRQDAAHVREAVGLYRRAVQAVPYNADYRYRLVRAEWMIHDPNLLTDSTADIAADPSRLKSLLLDAQIRLREPAPDEPAIRRDYETAVRLDPNDVDIRRQFGDALVRFGDHDAAVRQYRAAIDANNALPPDEPKRLPPDRLVELEKLAE